ncbi:hypothetical protein, conserved [Leishmania tarentolae]|uniref:MORN repeat-containing protein 5 n=1 Tax=Leishmania tarentolae TaxID=5689 RepID=A0A640KLN2_LEITA|nr:hypothetical protein, conserved [Leishmania tarentolae]
MEFIQCAYIGQRSTDGRRFEGLGRYTFPNGDVYIGGVRDGQFHGHGVVFFRNPPGCTDGSNSGLSTCANPPPPRHPPPQDRHDSVSANDAEDNVLQAFLSLGQTSPVSTASAGESTVTRQDFAALVGNSGDGGGGQYRGVWEHGRHVEGHYVFQDGLVYGSSSETEGRAVSAQSTRGTSWTYCHGSDRRLWEEYLQNVAPVLPHEALLGGARLLHARKGAMSKTGSTGGSFSTSAGGTGEGLPMVLPRAFVHARTAPAFAKGQLTSIDDPRVTRWAEAAAAAEERAVASHLQQQKQKQAGSPPARSSRRPTVVGVSEGAEKSLEAPLELIESSIALQLAMAVPTEGLRADGRLDDTEADVGDAKDEAAGEDGIAVEALTTIPAAPHPALNLTVCRVLDVEDVNRVLVQIVAEP